MTRRRHPAPAVVDASAAAVVAVLEFVISPKALSPRSWWIALLVSVVYALPVAFRRVAPWLALLLALAGFVVSVETFHAEVGLAISCILVTYSIAAEFPPLRATLAAGLLWTPILVATLFIPPRLNPYGLPVAYLLFTTGAWASASFFVGRTAYNRRAYATSLEARARTAEENQRVLADRAVADERRRIARELHDVVAHHVSVMSVLATGARRVLTREPAAAEEALRTVEETGRATLREMRMLLSVLRTDAEPDVELGPQPGLAGINAALEQVREAGLPATLLVDGDPTGLDPGVARTVHRIVQEALTNTLKHAGEATATVRLTVRQRWVELEVLDTGRGPGLRPRPMGHGLLGMRERVGLYGGTLHTGPRPGGGFRVHARIPLARPADSAPQASLAGPAPQASLEWQDAVPVPRAPGEEAG